jgi:ABC-type branched-subunit amino acid transport system ATPase component
MTHEGPLLELRDVGKSFGRLAAIDGVDLEVQRGEVLGIAGPNGAGKSTLFNVITGVPFRADRGSIRFDGQSIERLRPRVICRRGIARTFQAEVTFDTLSAYNNVFVAAKYGCERSDVDRPSKRAADALEYVGLWDRRDDPAADLPVLAKKKLMIASALACEPKLLLLDEPAAGLTEGEQEEIAQLVGLMSSRGVAVVVIEHVLPLLTRIASRMVILASGRVLVSGTPAEVVADQRVIEAYTGAPMEGVA